MRTMSGGDPDGSDREPRRKRDVEQHRREHRHRSVPSRLVTRNRRRPLHRRPPFAGLAGATRCPGDALWGACLPIFATKRPFRAAGARPSASALWLLRVSDKGRASAAGTIHDYVYPCPMDLGMLERWGIAPPEFDEALRRHENDEQLYAWFEERVRPEDVRDCQRVAPTRACGEPRSSGRRRGRPGQTHLMGSTVEFVRPDGQTAPGYFAPAGSRRCARHRPLRGMVGARRSHQSDGRSSRVERLQRARARSLSRPQRRHR